MNLRSHGMSLYDRDYVREEPRPQSLPTPKTAVGVLLAINVAVYLLDRFAGRTGWLARILEIQSGHLLEPWNWWTFLTYGFAHSQLDTRHLLFNMLGLYFFGRPIENLVGSTRFYAFYLTAVVLGAIGFCARHYLMNDPTPAIGASGAIFALTTFYALKWPHNKILLWFVIPVPAWIAAAGFLLLELASLNNMDNVAHDVHIVGAIYGFIFFKTAWTFQSLAPNALLGMFRGSSRSSTPRRRAKVKLYDPDAKAQKLDKEADRILEKLHQQGADSLTAKEKKTLEDYSRRMQQKRQ